MKTIEGQNDKCQFKFRIGFHKIGNQEPYFSITGDTWELGKSRIDRNSLGCGALDINEYFPELGYLQKYHLTSVKEPMHYIANSLFHASDRDHNGLLKGEKRQIRNGRTNELCWQRVAIDSQGNEIDLYSLRTTKDSNTQPDGDNLKIEWRPWYRVGEGKDPDLNAARSCAIWPDAKLEDFTKENLINRLPELMKQFKQDILKAGLEWPEGY